MFNELMNFINNKDFKIILYKNMLNIINYEKIISIEEEYISIKKDNTIIRLKGEKLFLKKILDNELLITGKIKSVEVIDE